ncbi:MAG TPA: aldehyde dehydrogenase family protein [Bryobacteraceae bacterium]|jgi:aldehyde dehydrogenase (NAD+)|nr:aldehyde dehydrogenase family protein [Bryobacteraceae bacterium]
MSGRIEGNEIISYNPATGAELGRVPLASAAEYESVLAKTSETFERWRMVPAPQRGEIVREIGDELRKAKQELGRMVTLEAGKIVAEGQGEVQEMIDVADFACGLSRQLYGLSMHSERPGHRMYEQWHPLGVVGVVSAFNFPVAVWSWNALIAMVCGDTVLWKPSLKVPLCAVAVQEICDRVLDRHGWNGILNLVIGADDVIGERMIRDKRVPLISATGSTRMGRHVAQVVAERLGRSLLELGGNNAVVVMDDADPDLVVRAVLFGAVGTAGQRCTSIRRLFLQKGIARKVTDRLLAAYQQIRIGDPSEPATLMGPLIDEEAVDNMIRGLTNIQEEGGKILTGGKRLQGNFVDPAIVQANPGMAMLKEELFAPVLYLIEFDTLDQAISWHNDVPQGLSSAIFTANLTSAEVFLSARGSDCGIANVNIGTSGAEIGGAFGGEKDTGGGRESGSDAWKAYMRRQTVTVNWSGELPLSQGIKFDVT